LALAFGALKVSLAESAMQFIMDCDTPNAATHSA
jgi:hypothetical protein